MDERTRIVVLDVASYLCLLVAFLWSGRKLDVELGSLDVPSLLAGAIEQFCVLYATERDPLAAVLDSLRGQLAFGVASWLWTEAFHRLAPSEESATIGGLVGGVCYRLVFGVVFDVPDGRRRTPSVLDRR